MPLVNPPKVLRGLKLKHDPDVGWVLPDDATEEQKKAYEEYHVQIQKALDDAVVIEE